MAKPTTSLITMRKELRRFILSLSVVATLVFSVAMVLHYSRGLENGIFTTLLLDIRAYEQAYAKNPQTPLPQYYSAWFSLDDESEIPTRFHSIIPFKQLQPWEFYDQEVNVEEGLRGELEDDYQLVVGYRHILPDQRSLFVVIDFDATKFTREDIDEINPNIMLLAVIGGSYLVISLCVVWFYNRRTSQKINQLADWAQQLQLDNLHQPRPDLRYTELEQIADQLQASLQQMADVLSREHQFLRHASHELRTPIAVIRANLELLNKLPQLPQQQGPIERLVRANKGMQDTVETMLWLSREVDSEALPKEPVDLAALLYRLQEELGYLLQDKPVQVQLQVDVPNSAHMLPATAIYIVLSNLVRNAFQYTAEGSVELRLAEHSVMVTNRETDVAADGDYSVEDSNGLGLILVQRICQRLGWQFDMHKLTNGTQAVLTLTNHDVDLA